MIGDKDIFINALQENFGIVTKASEACGISRQTHYNWYKDDEDYKRKVDDIDDICLDFAENVIFEAMGNQDTQAAVFYLKHKGKKRGYIESKNSDVNIHIEQPLFPDE